MAPPKISTSQSLELVCVDEAHKGSKKVSSERYDVRKTPSVIADFEDEGRGPGVKKCTCF